VAENVALGGRSVATTPPPEACELAVEATRALGVDLDGVDLLRDDGLVVLEVNGAVDMKTHYSLSRDVFAAVLERLERVASGGPERFVPVW
jgi:glutathione synthase/RimK-type ligase-like ATP-grasp enzyme